jgi:LysM repeat protein
MDTISRENNSVLPLAGVIAGALALLLAVVALFKLSSAGKEIAQLKEDLGSRMSSMESQVSAAASAAESARSFSRGLESQVNAAFTEVSNQLASVRAEIAIVKESLTKPKPAAAGAGAAAKGPVVAGPDEYIVKSGDTGMKIARANGVSIADLQAVNPGLNWTKLKVGDKVKLPKK